MEDSWIKLYYTEHDSMLIRTFATFFDKEDYLDVTFICKGGKRVLANKLVLSCLSTFLKSLLSEWEGNDEMITLLLPEVDHNILKLIFNFVYEGVTKLSENEYKDFKQVLQMLQIILPGATVIKRNVLSVPQNPPPPVAKLQKKTVTLNASNSTAKKSDTENDKRENSNAVEEKPRRRSSDLDDDPLNVPDLYYVPSTLTGQTASGSKQTHSKNTGDLEPSNLIVQVKSDLNMDGYQETKNSKTLQQDAKRSLGRRSSARNREDCTDMSGSARKRICRNTSSESDNSSDIPSGMELSRRKHKREQQQGSDIFKNQIKENLMNVYQNAAKNTLK